MGVEIDTETIRARSKFNQAGPRQAAFGPEASGLNDASPSQPEFRRLEKPTLRMNPRVKPSRGSFASRSAFSTIPTFPRLDTL